MDWLSGIRDYSSFNDDEFHHQVQVDQSYWRFAVFGLWLFDWCNSGWYPYYLAAIYSKKEVFDILEINAESEYLTRFLKFHNNRIQKICPGFAYNPDMNTVSFFILRNMSVAGLFLAHRTDKTILNVGLVYVLPEYKDFKNGKFVYFSLREKFRNEGYTSITAQGNNLRYFRYLKKLGFKEISNGKFKKGL